MKWSVRVAMAALLTTTLGACAGRADKVAEVSATETWRQVATPFDRDRVRKWRGAWTGALAKAQASGHAAAIAEAGAVLQPDAALPDPRPPEGDYRCQVTKIGARRPGASDLVRYPPFTCRIRLEGDILSFATLDGAQRPVGLLFPDGDARMVFLGTLMLSDETAAMQYGRDFERDMAGTFERIGDRHWRLALPYPHWESMFDVIDLTPLSAKRAN